VQASGWPIGLGDLLPYYANAYGICDLDPSPFEKGIAGFKGRDLPNLDHDRLEPYFLQYSAPTRFGPTYGPELERAKNIQVLLHANVTDISANADASAVDHVAFRSLSGRTGRVRARRVVLCCGGIENARMLLLSNGRVQAGLGNQNDVVGRYFMDHPFGRVGLLQRTGDVAIGKALGEHQIGDRQYRFGLSLAQKVQAHDRVLGCGIQFWPTSDSAPDSPSGETTLISRYTDKIVKNFNHYWAQLKQQLGEQESPGEAEFFDIMAVTEQAPNPMSRVSLSRERDALGLPRTRVDWQLTELDRRTREFAVRAIATEFGRLDTGRVRMASWLQDRGNWNDNVEDYKHHMGTTRMAANPRLGVVDKDCRVHGLANLYIAGSSVFPTSSIVNPTLTIVALALRLSESLKKSLIPTSIE
jgi:choline dehydrogenase-like flavoprotein